MNRLRWWLLGSTVPVAAACAVSAGTSGPGLLADTAVALLGVATAALVWWHGRSLQRGLRGWRLFAVAPLLPVVGFVAVLVAGPADPAEQVVARWLPTVPGYLIAIASILTLVDCRRLRGGARGTVELALFGTACLLVVQLLVLGPRRSWLDLEPVQGAVLAAAVVVTSATMAAALVLLGVIDSRRQRMALALLAGTVLLATGRTLGTSAMLSGAPGLGDLSRFLVAGGLVLLGVAVLVDVGPSADAGRRPPRSGRSTRLGQLLPHLAMVVAVLASAAATITGQPPNAVTVAGSVLCVGLAAAHRWITSRDEERLGALLRRSESYFRSLVQSSGDPVLILDPDLRVTWTSPALDRLVGGGQATGRDLLELLHPEDVLPVGRALQAGPAPDLLVLRLRGADGGWRVLEASASDLRHDPTVGAVVLHCRDVTERLARERALEEVAFTDPLTGLPNRAGWSRVLEAALATAGTPGAGAATLLLIELDGLGAVREDVGREAVSTVLVELGRRLRATVRSSEPVARVGGGAFAVLADGSGTAVDLLADRCLAVIEQPLPTEVGIFDLSASVGIVELAHGVPVPELLSRAELAVRAAAAAGPGTAERYRPALGSAADRRARLREELPGAWARGELAVLFQPVVSLGEQRITGVEALLRWRHPELGEIPPTEFLPIAERAGLVADLQRWALEQAARTVVVLPDTGPPLRLGVNISAAHVAARTLVGDVAAVLRVTGLAPERLVLEITEETVLAEGEHAAVDVEALRLMGVHVALDTFGTGRSSLSHLTRLPIDVLKLDRSFVTRIDRDPKARALCESVIAIGRSLGLDVVAVGVETPAQLGALRGLGCGFAQGFLLARPMPPARLAELLGEGAGVLWPGLVGSR